MATHIGVLPVDVLHALSVKLNEDAESRAEPRGLSFLRLPHPRTGVPSLFLPYDLPLSAKEPKSKTGMLEVQSVEPTNARTWFMDQEVISDGKLLLMTPIDPAFLLIPILQSVRPADDTLGNFKPADDIFEDAATKLESASQLAASTGPKDPSLLVSQKDVLRLGSLDCIQQALKRICDVKEVTPEIVVYRYSSKKIVDYLRAKVARLATPRVFEGSKTLIRGLAKDGLMEDGKENLLEAGRTRAACDLISQYIPPSLRAALIASYEFKLLDEYFQAMEDEAAAALATANANVASKAKSKAAKSKDTQTATGSNKRKGSKNSQGVEKLKKVNVTSMSKISTFFKKA